MGEDLPCEGLLVFERDGCLGSGHRLLETRDRGVEDQDACEKAMVGRVRSVLSILIRRTLA